MPATPTTSKFPKLNGGKMLDKATKRMGAAVSKLVSRDTIFVPSSIATSSPATPARPSLDSTCSSTSPSATPESTVLSPSRELAPLPTYSQCIQPETRQGRASHIRSQEIAINKIEAALRTKELEIQELESGNKLLAEYADTLNYDQVNDVELRTELIEMEAELERLRLKYPHLLPPPVPARPHSTSDTDWTCVKCSERNHEGVFKCKMCLMPSLRVNQCEVANCRCSNCCGEPLESTDTPGWIIFNPIRTTSTPTSG